MPIIIAREGPVEPKVIKPPTPEQRQQLWEAVVKNFCDKNPDKLRALFDPAPAESA